MTDHKFTDDEITKALECCSPVVAEDFDCVNCPYNKKGCNSKLLRDALALINRQKAEIESYRKELGISHLYNDVSVHTKTLEDYYKFKKYIKTEAIKAFAERLKLNLRCYSFLIEYLNIIGWEIDNLVKEMTEVDNG